MVLPNKKPLNILFINSIDMYGGGEVWMISIIEELILRGHSVSLICKPRSEILNEALKRHIDVFPLKIRGDFDPVTIFKLIAFFKRNRIDIVVANVGKDIRLAGIAAKIASDIFVIALQQVDRQLKNNLRYRITYNSLAKMIVANSFATKKTLLNSASWLLDEKIKVIHHGINIEKYSERNTRDLRSHLHLTQDDMIIGFVGRLNIQKGIKYMLDAFRMVAKEFENVHLVVAGTGELEKMVEEYLEKFSFENRIHLLGFRKDIPDLMRTFDIFLLPSLWEGFGIVLIEAMAAGIPIVATNTSSIPEIVDNGRNGFLVPPEDSDAIVETLVKLISNEQLRNRFGNEGKRIVQERFTIEKMTDNYEELLYEQTKV